MFHKFTQGNRAIIWFACRYFQDMEVREQDQNNLCLFALLVQCLSAPNTQISLLYINHMVTLPNNCIHRVSL